MSPSHAALSRLDTREKPSHAPCWHRFFLCTAILGSLVLNSGCSYMPPWMKSSWLYGKGTIETTEDFLKKNPPQASKAPSLLQGDKGEKVDKGG